MQDILNHLLSFLNSIPSEFWGFLIETIIAAIPVSIAGIVIKKWRDIDNEKKMLIIIIGTSMLAGVLEYLHGNARFAPWTAIVQGWFTFAATQPVYFLFVKPLYARFQIWFAEQVAKVALSSEAKAAAVPAEGLPITVSASTGTSDFSL